MQLVDRKESRCELRQRINLAGEVVERVPREIMVSSGPPVETEKLYREYSKQQKPRRRRGLAPCVHSPSLLLRLLIFVFDRSGS